MADNFQIRDASGRKVTVAATDTAGVHSIGAIGAGTPTFTAAGLRARFKIRQF